MSSTFREQGHQTRLQTLRRGPRPLFLTADYSLLTIRNLIILPRTEDFPYDLSIVLDELYGI